MPRRTLVVHMPVHLVGHRLQEHLALQDLVKKYQDFVTADKEEWTAEQDARRRANAVNGRWGFTIDSDLAGLPYSPPSFRKWWSRSSFQRKMEDADRRHRAEMKELLARLPITLTPAEFNAFKFPYRLHVRKLTPIQDKTLASITVEKGNGEQGVVFIQNKTEESKDAKQEFLASLPKSFTPNEIRQTLKEFGLKATLSASTVRVVAEPDGTRFVLKCFGAGGQMLRVIRGR